VYQTLSFGKRKRIKKIHKNNWQFKPDIVFRLVKLSAGVTAQFIISSASWIFFNEDHVNFWKRALSGIQLLLELSIHLIARMGIFKRCRNYGWTKPWR